VAPPPKSGALPELRITPVNTTTRAVPAIQVIYIINKKNMSELIQLKYIVAAAVYAFLGVFILLISFWIIEKITPDNTYKQVTEHKNVAVAIIAAAFIIAIAIIIASAIH
jgi:uncharacterized membrane protein YjfL (UPF0719 family)